MPKESQHKESDQRLSDLGRAGILALATLPAILGGLTGCGPPEPHPDPQGAVVERVERPDIPEAALGQMKSEYSQSLYDACRQAHAAVSTALEEASYSGRIPENLRIEILGNIDQGTSSILEHIDSPSCVSISHDMSQAAVLLKAARGLIADQDLHGDFTWGRGGVGSTRDSSYMALGALEVLMAQMTE